MSGPQVVVIGAGVVGAALADELTERGWTDVTVVDAGPIPHTGGSSTHAPGLVFQANGSRMMTELATYTVKKLVSLATEEGPCFLQVGGLEVATTPERLRELHRRAGWLAANGVPARILTPAECVEQHDLLDPDLVLGGLLTPTDGLAKAVRAVDAQTRRAVERGATLRPGTEVLDVLVEDGRVVGVETSQGRIDAEVVVCCAGIWGQKVAAMVGLDLPLTPLEHQLVRTTPVPAMAGQAEEVRRPILRHQGEDLYYRDDVDRQVVGSYAHRPIPVTVDDFDDWGGEVMPSVRTFTPEDFEGPWKDSQTLLPALAEAAPESGINGMFSFTTDGGPLIGESPDVAGFWVAEAVWVTHSAGVGRAVAELLVDGVPTTDLHEAALDRFERHQRGPAYVLERDQQNFVEVYDVLHPLQPMESPRPLRLSPFHRRQEELDAFFLEANGWERPQWYGANASLLGRYDVPVPGEWAARYWSPIAGAEARATRDGVALYDMTALKRIEVVGRGATEFLQGLVTGNVATSVGSVTYCLLLDERGRIRSDVTVARLSAPPGQQRYQVGANGNLDLAYLQALAPADVFVHDITPGTCCLGLWGPLAREVISSVSTDDWSNDGVRYFRGLEAHVGMVPVTALRLSYVGELGWELYTTADLGQKLWDTLWAAGREHGIVAGGRAAFTSLRLEKGYRSFGSDMTWDHTPAEAGLSFAVKTAKEEFVGKAALEELGEPTRRLVCLTSPDPLAVVMGKEPVLADGEPVGYVTSAAWGFTVERAIAYAWVPAALAEVGTELEIGYFDQRLPYAVTAEPLFDPSMSRLRG
ncbi:GcvT family protein [Nocardioides lianchengensis]|uniref:Glycine cleavage system T protein (Aminomethyltransferase) n=1 Tax=Nocardioides lianchengensis TaxID=1045774 RepID=A0A1G6Y5U6_9ACTN|nr:FAD-dependent oxidoreductase [Nocardioides lianchengensis]NYG13542.1 glycine cleavage system aminomethyltransferase T/glycine/D-amino acid oxidase-like deaminating enzyme [Nocardioides lianchengensis]SDD84975.1 Glycine cleavage system T protein (aminomethyltransferase) [Nocardioides lianchengensis]